MALAQKNDSMLPMNRWCMHGRYLAYATIKYFHLVSEYIRVLLGTAKIALVVVLCNMYYYPQIRLFKFYSLFLPKNPIIQKIIIEPV